MKVLSTLEIAFPVYVNGDVEVVDSDGFVICEAKNHSLALFVVDAIMRAGVKTAPFVEDAVATGTLEKAVLVDAVLIDGAALKA